MDASVRYSSIRCDPPAQRARHGEKRCVFLANRDRKWRTLRVISTRRAAVTNEIARGIGLRNDLEVRAFVDRRQLAT